MLADGVGRLAEDSRKRSPRFSIDCLGVASGKNESGEGSNGESNNIYLDFRHVDANHPLTRLHDEASLLVRGLLGTNLSTENNAYHPKINLMEYANLPPIVMADAAEFAKGVAKDVGVPVVASAWRLVLLRYHSEAAGDDWSHGSWANDVSWEYLSSYTL